MHGMSEIILYRMTDAEKAMYTVIELCTVT